MLRNIFLNVKSHKIVKYFAININFKFKMILPLILKF